MQPIYQSSSQLKQTARRQLEGKYGTAIGMQLLIQLAGVFAGTLVALFFPATTVLTSLIQSVVTFFATALLNIASAGVALYHLNIACGGNYEFGNLWYGFKNQFAKSFQLSLVVTAISVVYQTLVMLPLNLYTRTFRTEYLFLAVLLMLITLPIYFYFSLTYSLVFYIMLDYPTYSAGEILHIAPKMMKGHKRRLLYISLSFLPLLFLGLMTCGIGTFWVNVYRNMTVTDFYLDLRNPQNTEMNC